MRKKGVTKVSEYHEKKHEHKNNCQSILQKAFEKLLKDIFEDDQKNTSLWMS
ncbi:hypothetical protein V7094_26850 [Priestia megaterium]|jgi:hypothetical protein|uniref:hypothetical protein n=1 Tax=Priestia megaterium TaxID=1404 RepID=UPI0015967214|nr:hypothetical protein [Priestia megaterium]MDR7207309.1 hypothetical protein [Priestia megaterium]MED3855705.1 hypothetical protein [Priestia megaterium]UMZ35902.1 hypothetical protein MGJ28_27615 [Priestia megaterium]